LVSRDGAQRDLDDGATAELPARLQIGGLNPSFRIRVTWIGTAAPPLPTMTLRNRPGRAAAANNDDEVPMSGPTRWGLSNPNASAMR
jgi:hypothetical protein